MAEKKKIDLSKNESSKDPESLEDEEGRRKDNVSLMPINIQANTLGNFHNQFSLLTPLNIQSGGALLTQQRDISDPTNIGSFNMQQSGLLQHSFLPQHLQTQQSDNSSFSAAAAYMIQQQQQQQQQILAQSNNNFTSIFSLPTSQMTQSTSHSTGQSTSLNLHQMQTSFLSQKKQAIERQQQSHEGNPMTEQQGYQSISNEVSFTNPQQKLPAHVNRPSVSESNTSVGGTAAPSQARFKSEASSMSRATIPSVGASDQDQVLSTPQNEVTFLPDAGTDTEGFQQSVSEEEGREKLDEMSQSKRKGDSTSEEESKMSEKKQRAREKNRVHSRNSRLRKKDSIQNMKEENAKLQMFRMITETMADMVSLHDFSDEARLIYGNPSFLSRFPLPVLNPHLHNVIGLSANFLHFVHEEDTQGLIECLRLVRNDATKAPIITLRVKLTASLFYSRIQSRIQICSAIRSILIVSRPIDNDTNLLRLTPRV